MRADSPGRRYETGPAPASVLARAAEPSRGPGQRAPPALEARIVRHGRQPEVGCGFLTRTAPYGTTTAVCAKWAAASHEPSRRGSDFRPAKRNRRLVFAVVEVADGQGVTGAPVQFVDPRPPGSRAVHGRTAPNGQTRRAARTPRRSGTGSPPAPSPATRRRCAPASPTPCSVVLQLSRSADAAALLLLGGGQPAPFGSHPFCSRSREAPRRSPARSSTSSSSASAAAGR